METNKPLTDYLWELYLDTAKSFGGPAQGRKLFEAGMIAAFQTIMLTAEKGGSGMVGKAMDQLAGELGLLDTDTNTNGVVH